MWVLLLLFHFTEENTEAQESLDPAQDPPTRDRTKTVSTKQHAAFGNKELGGLSKGHREGSELGGGLRRKQEAGFPG